MYICRDSVNYIQRIFLMSVNDLCLMSGANVIKLFTAESYEFL
jgi:hypothetical protein